MQKDRKFGILWIWKIFETTFEWIEILTSEGAAQKNIGFAKFLPFLKFLAQIGSCPGDTVKKASNKIKLASNKMGLHS